MTTSDDKHQGSGGVKDDIGHTESKTDSTRRGLSLAASSVANHTPQSSLK